MTEDLRNGVFFFIEILKSFWYIFIRLFSEESAMEREEAEPLSEDEVEALVEELVTLLRDGSLEDTPFE